MHYKLDAAAAKQATGTGRITETGGYIGKFTRAEAIVSQRGAKGIEFAFEDESGDTADFLSIYTFNANGEKIFGYNLIMSLMTCLRIKELNREVGTVQKYDAFANQNVKTQAEIYPGLMNKPIGVILQAEEYQAKDGSIKTRMNLAGFFEASTHLMAKEILENVTVPEMADKMIKRLPVVKPLKTGTSSTASSSSFSGSSSINDDDIPF